MTEGGIERPELTGQPPILEIHKRPREDLAIYWPMPSEWQACGGLREMGRKLSRFLITPRRIASGLFLNIAAQAYQLPEKGELEGMIEEEFVRIHKSSWVTYENSQWRLRSPRPAKVRQVTSEFFTPYFKMYPPRLSSKLATRGLIWPIRIFPWAELEMGRLGVTHQRTLDFLYIDQSNGGLKIFVPRTREEKQKERVVKQLSREGEAFFLSFLEEAEYFLSAQKDFHLDIWMPQQDPERRLGVKEVKLFGAYFSGITLLEIIRGFLPVSVLGV